ncbi:Tartrate transporter [Mycena indigotica]|uniref:Tartrate transporter n=1 Tax=Mycena indigotica TaxID=2126181 RepID=A0A8H6SFW1_9AGAR|nr:Tartrate transporter [Mycena indigotica]KAF7298654.1 Tartrate transporter [Mycena indigotica]
MSKENEKDDIAHDEVRVSSVEQDGSALPPLPAPGTPERLAMERKLVRRLDYRLLPTIFVIYIMNYIDASPGYRSCWGAQMLLQRNGITTARLKGLQQDLSLTDLQYSVVLSVLFATYSPFQVPSNMRSSKLSCFPTRFRFLTTSPGAPSWYIGFCVIGWGLTSLLTGVSVPVLYRSTYFFVDPLPRQVTKNYGGILACRLFIGLPEAAFYPGAAYLLSRWYTKKELAFRSAILYSGLLISNAFGALIAAGILGGMEGVRGVRAWRWLFYIEGAITIAIGLLTLCVHGHSRSLLASHLSYFWLNRWLLPDYPNNTRWIKGDLRRLAQARLAEDAGEADKDNESDTPVTGLKMALMDPLVWAFAIMNTAQLLGLSFINFFPTLTKTLGFNTTISLLLAAPPWVISSIVCCVNAWHADKTGERYFHLAGLWWIAILGFIIGLSTFNTGARYFAMFLMAVSYASFPLTAVWVANVIPRPPAKRAAAIGIVNGIGNLGNLMGSYVWKAEWGPDYHQSMGISLGSLVISSLIMLGIKRHLMGKNKKLDADERAAMDGADMIRVKEAAMLEGISLEQALQNRRGFRYVH